ncbi:MAG: glycoside hydrolase family 127 protein [Bacteroidales bacterium]|nr:glycoside hydrolase family 127 protein [Bacteroidales bacterium]
MKTRISLLLLVLFVSSCSEPPKESDTLYLQNRTPLHPKKYVELPLGTIRPEGWLLHQLELMRDGMTGHLDEWYPSVVGERNGWLGGDGDGWERSVYWLDGLVPLAWLLDDEELKAKAMPWIEWTLNSQTETGYFGPVPFEEEPEPEPGLQKTRRQDWWPKMVMLKVLQQYYEVSGDERVIDLLLNYFRFQLDELPNTPLDHWTFWANRRGGDNLMVVHWLYNQTGESFLLELGDLIHEQTFPWTEVFLNEDCYKGGDLDHLYPYNTNNRYPFDQELISRLCTRQLQSFHCVNLAQGIKEPMIRYQQEPDPVYLEAVEKALSDILLFHGQPQGMYGGDEPMHGNDPTQGIELCSVVELMYSLEKMIAISGNPAMMDHLEKIAYNALPTQVSDDFTSRQYFQQANQVMLTRHRHNFYEEDHHGHTDLCYGLISGFPCCTCNLHQGWPKLVSHLWYATADGGVAAVVYAPCNMTARVANDDEVSIREETNYPFEERIRFHISTKSPVQFPLHLRIPGWCSEPGLSINGENVLFEVEEGMMVLDRMWQEGDLVELHLPMEVSLNRWVENAVSVERGPLVYVLKIGEEWKAVESDDIWGDYSEVRPLDPWNIGLLEAAVLDPETGFEFVTVGKTTNSQEERIYPWSLENAPVALRTKGRIIPDWKLHREMAGPLPHSLPLKHLLSDPPQEITLIPYGCSTLRITEFPVVR